MRRFAILCAVILFACAKSENPPAGDTPVAAPPVAPATISLADVAGKWNVRSMDENGTNVVESELTATADTSGWTMIRPNQSPIPVRIIVVAGDSIVTESGPFPSTLRKGVPVTTRTVYRLQGDRLVGTIEAHFATSHGDSVVQRRTEATRKP